jgi:tetratricopeptide (TPR) repeat protein
MPSAPDIKTPPPTTPDDDSPAAFFQAGLRLLQVGQLQAAEQYGRQALAIDAGHADSLHLMGLLSLLSKQHDLAIEWFVQAIRQNPDVADYFFNLANALRQQGRLDEAIKSFDRALVLQPDYAEGWYALGELLEQQKRFDEAIMSFDLALKTNASYREAANASGLLYFETRRYDEAIARFSRSADIDPNQPGAFNHISRCYWGLRRFEDALAYGYKAIALAPDNPELNKNIGLLLQKLDRHEEALAWFDKALALRADFAPALNDRSTSLFALRRIDAAFADIDRAIAVDPQCADYHWNKALLQLLTGDFTGWRGREWGRRCTLVNFVDRKFTKPQWFGEAPIAGKTILLHSDEGFGDTIQFCRYARLVAGRGARVILEVQDALHPLLSGLEGVARCLPQSAGALPDFDLHCPLSGLPLAFKTRLDTIPAASSYLPPLPHARLQAWQARLGAHDRLRVGLVWSGNPGHSNDRSRSMSLKIMSTLFDAGARFYSLQKEPRAEDAAILRDCNEIVDDSADLTDFVETAALVACLDLVISVDTSVAHLSAALGRPTWILLPFTPDYRWLLARDDSPWYPTVRLFRQDERCDYTTVLQRVRAALKSVMAAFKPIPDSDTPTDLRQDTPAALSRAGLRLLQAGQLAEAERCGQRALALDAGHADSLHLMGLLSLLSKQHDLAIEWFAQAIRQNPGVADYFFNLASALRQRGRLDDAIKIYDRGLTLQPGFADGWCALGELLRQQERVEEASASFAQALKVDPCHREAANAAGALAFEAGQLERALGYFDQSIEIDPAQAGAFKFRGLCQLGLKQYDAALVSSRRAVELAPENADINNNTGFLLQRIGRHEDALVFFDAAIACDPGLASAYNNRGISLTELHRFHQASDDFDRALAIDPDFSLARGNSALLKLLLGDFAKGWPAWQARKGKSAAGLDRKFERPLWLGKEPLAGKTVLFHSDEGFGDSIQYARYASLAAQRGARVILEVDDSLHPLLSGLDGVSLCLPRSAGTLPGFDLHCPLCSLPLAFRTLLETVPAAPSYLPPPPQARVREWQMRLGVHDRLRVGLVWSGNPDHNNDRNRSMRLRTLSSILDVDATFISLQKNPRGEDKAALLEYKDLVDLTADIVDFADTAALISCLDLVISVDTSVAHLSGALGQATWILLPFTPDFRWLLDRDDSPWYPSVRLFRQDERRDYAVVLARVRDALNTLVAAFGQTKA